MMEVRSEKQNEALEAERAAEEAMDLESIDEHDLELFETLTQGETEGQQAANGNSSDDRSGSNGAERLLDYWQAQEEHRMALQETSGRSSSAAGGAEAPEAAEPDSLSVEQDLFGRFESALKRKSQSSEQMANLLFGRGKSSAGVDHRERMEEILEDQEEADLLEELENAEFEHEYELERKVELLEQKSQTDSREEDNASKGNNFGGDGGGQRSRTLWMLLEAAKNKSLTPIGGLQGKAATQAEVRLPDVLEARFEALEQAVQAQRQKAEDVIEQMASYNPDEALSSLSEKFERFMGDLQARAGDVSSPLQGDMLKQFRVLFDGVWFMAEATSMGSFFMMFSMGGFLPFLFSPSMDKRAIIVEKAHDKLKGSGNKGASGKGQSPGQSGEEEKLGQKKKPGVEHEELPESLKSLKKIVADKKKDLRDQLALKLMATQEEDAAKAKHAFLLEVLQTYDAFPVHGNTDQVAHASVWFSAFDALTPEVLLAQCEGISGRSLPELENLIVRYHSGKTVLKQAPDGSVSFDDAAQEVLTHVFDCVSLNLHAPKISGASLREGIAQIANTLQVPVVVVEAQGDDLMLYGAGLGIPERPLLPMQVWDVDWLKQRNVLYLNGGEANFLMRPY